MNYERDNIRQMSGYASGEQPLGNDVIKLNTNENPYPPSPSLSEALTAIDIESLRRYPPPTADRFRNLAAELHNLTKDNVIATRGGDELLRLVITTFVDPGETIGMTRPTYSLYPVLAQIQNCPTLNVPLGSDWRLPDNLARQFNRAGVKLTLLVNPHAPSGALIPYDELTKLADELDSLLLLDEAYIDFVDHEYETSRLVNEYENVIILRTLSKGYSLAGLRFGYGLASPSLIEPMMNKTRDSYNLDLISQRLAETAITDQRYAKSTWERVIAERDRLREALVKLGFSSPKSQSNFLLVSVPQDLSAGALYQKLKERHILVRYFEADGLSDKLRITVGTPEENSALEAALSELTQP